MTFARANSLGWALFENLTSAQMNIIDINQSRALDGDAGGTYNLSAPLVLNGTVEISNLIATTGSTFDDIVCNTLQVLNLANSIRDLTTVGFTTLTDTVSIAGLTNFTGVTTVNSPFTQQSNTFQVNSSATLQSNGIANFDGATNFTANSIVIFDSNTDIVFNRKADFNQGYIVTSAVQSVHLDRPDMQDGIQFGSTDKVHYGSATSWTNNQSLAAGAGPRPELRFDWADGSHWNQIDAFGFGESYAIVPSIFYGNEPIELTSISYRTDGSNLSGGSPTGNTSFSFVVYNEDANPVGSKLIVTVDANDNSDIPHTTTSSGLSIIIDPVTEWFLIRFTGYEGGTTLSINDHYSLYSFKCVWRINAKDIY